MIPQLKKQVAELTERVRALSNIKIEGYNVRAGSGGISFVHGTSKHVSQWMEKTVVIVVKPEVDDVVLKVREAKYRNIPPKPCTGDGESATCFYEWVGEVFDAYPPLGVKAVSYSGDETTSDADVPPKLTTRFHHVHRENNVWMLNVAAGGGGETDVCVVHEPFAGGTSWSGASIRIRVVHIKLAATGTGYISAEPQLLADGVTNAPGYSVVRCWPGTNESFWQYIKGTVPTSTPPILASNYVAVGTVMINGVEHISPIIPVGMFTPNPAFLAGDC